MTRRSSKLSTCILALFIAACTNAHAADLRVLGTQSMTLVWSEVGVIFEKQTGHKVVMTPHIAAAAKRMIDGGERFDIAILSPAVIDS